MPFIMKLMAWSDVLLEIFKKKKKNSKIVKLNYTMVKCMRFHYTHTPLLPVVLLTARFPLVLFTGELEEDEDDGDDDDDDDDTVNEDEEDEVAVE